MNAWMVGLLRYTLVAVTGTALIVVLVPRVKDRQIGADLKTLASHVEQSAERAGEHASRIAGEIRDAVPRPQRPAGLPAADLPPPPSPEAEPQVEPDAAVAAPDAVPVPRSAGSTMPEPGRVADAPDGRWAVVNTPRTAYYTTEGKFTAYLPPGFMLTVEDIKRNKDADLAVCRNANGEDGQRFLVKAGHLDIYRGSPDQITPGMRELVVQLAQLDVEIATRRREQRDDIREDNPHAAAYAKARSAYRSYWSRVQELQHRRDTGTGNARMEAMDALRQLKGEDRRIAQAYEQAKTAYEAWNEAHPRPTGDSPEIRRLVRERERLAATIEKGSSP